MIPWDNTHYARTKMTAVPPGAAVQSVVCVMIRKVDILGLDVHRSKLRYRLSVVAEKAVILRNGRRFSSIVLKHNFDGFDE
jgi:hypothetical protein